MAINQSVNISARNINLIIDADYPDFDLLINGYRYETNPQTNKTIFILDKCVKMQQNTEAWSVNDLFTFTDIIKDVSEIHKNICKINKYKSYSQKIIN